MALERALESCAIMVAPSRGSHKPRLGAAPRSTVERVDPFLPLLGRVCYVSGVELWKGARMDECGAEYERRAREPPP